MKFSKKNMSQSKHSNLDTIKKNPKTKKLNIGELLATKPDNTYIDRSKNKNLKLLKVYGNYLIEYNNNTFFCNIKVYGEKPKIKLELEEEYKLIKKYNLSYLNDYEIINNKKTNKAKSNDDHTFNIKLFLKKFDKSILNEYMDNSNKYIKLFNDTENNKELETIKTLVKKNPSLLTKCELIKHNKDNECITISLTIKNKKFYNFYLGNLLHNDNINKYCNSIPGSVWLNIIDYYINNYTTTKYENKLCTLYDAANKKTFEFCPGLNKLYTADKLKQDEFINILLNPSPYKYNIGYDLYNLSIRMIFETGVKFYEKYGYITYDYPANIFNYDNYYKCLSNFIDDITNRKIIMSIPINKIIAIITFLYKLMMLEQKTNNVKDKKDNLNKQTTNSNTDNIVSSILFLNKPNTNSSVNITKSKTDDTITNKKDKFYNSLNNNEKIIFNMFDNKNISVMLLKDKYNQYYKLNGYIEYFKLINSQFVDEFLKTNTLITIHDMYKFTLYLLDNLNKLFNNYKSITYNNYYKYANIIEDFTSAVANSCLCITTYYLISKHIKYYNTCKYFINIGNDKYENFDKHVAMIHQKIKGVSADYIKPECFTTPHVNVIQSMIKKKEVVIFTPTEAYNKLLALNNKLLDYYKLN
jgi:hypothetical protein